MEQAAVDHAGEPLVPVTQRQRVLDQELYRQAPLGRFDLGSLDRLVQEVDAGDAVAPGGEEQGGVARAAAGVEDRAGDPIGCGDERPLRLADVSGRLPGIGVLKGGTVWHITHGRYPPSSGIYCYLLHANDKDVHSFLRRFQAAGPFAERLSKVPLHSEGCN